ncbi:hypothetical protein KR52_13930 [Synechococcus sp. KORDI-52]|uniref:hypothetical protein n=1 Tax=Synechococcus sp. KORDI-52 TaxID=585425 RepID=UPI0004E0506C|nr:hypothetical protein [Synechococcus sp. KORDI-52]AII50221.1 hypothetical protein KR52_13930 [Synechococcus sp. KORDI-52]
MLSSPFQQPSPRQNALALQIQEARTSGDEALLAGLISQWVHRYGFDGAAELDLSLPKLSALKREFSSPPMPVMEEEIALVDDVLVKNEVVVQDEVVAEDEMVVEEEEQIEAEDDLFIESEVMENGVVAEEETIVEQDESAAEETPLQRGFPAAPVPAPPISTPRSLRRWLPRREDDAFPKAS